MGSCMLSYNNLNQMKNESQNEKKFEPKKEMRKLKNEIKIECHIKGSSPFIPEAISDVLKKSTARIEFNEKKKLFTGFFMKINIKGAKFNFIITCNHSIAQKEIDSKQQINIYFGKSGNEEKKVIKLDNENRLIKSYEDLDTTLIQILKEDNIKEKRFLYPDLNYKNIGFSIYKDSQVFTAGYPNVDFYKEGRHISSGLITKLNENNFAHNCDTRSGSSGSPIINLFKLVIGIHNGGDKNEEYNIGTFIGAIIDRLNNENEKIFIKKEEIEPKKTNNLDNLLQNEIKNDDVDKEFGEITNIIASLFKNPQFVHSTLKAFNFPNIINMINKLSNQGSLDLNNLENDKKDLVDENNLKEFNDYLKSLEIILDKNHKKLNEV